MDHICVGYKRPHFRMCVYDVLKWPEELLIHLAASPTRAESVLDRMLSDLPNTLAE